ncbi:hypothetical protein FACS1894105_05180 [Clostridia bacterium]|nr:hypothetical protein FACS1894105_05180 [Clostridia bacterium]
MHNIGITNEKSVHRALKLYFEPDESFHEVRILGSIADICRDNMMTEIQCGSFSSKKKVLRVYLTAGNIA